MTPKTFAPPESYTLFHLFNPNLSNTWFCHSIRWLHGATCNVPSKCATQLARTCGFYLHKHYVRKKRAANFRHDMPHCHPYLISINDILIRQGPYQLTAACIQTNIPFRNSYENTKTKCYALYGRSQRHPAEQKGATKGILQKAQPLQPAPRSRRRHPAKQ